ncbi:MAG: hypothetical protein K2N94_13085 [Lachnospiraceae bacterium]|nr:hypothetical protein [Lachnospiraceae bacterium]
MKNKDLLHAMTDIDDRYIETVGSAKRKNNTAGRRLAGIGIAAAACLCIAVGAGILIGRTRRDSDGSPDGLPKPTGLADSNNVAGMDGAADPGSPAPTQAGQKNPSADAVYVNYAVAQAEYPDRIPYPNEASFSDNWDDFDNAWIQWRNDHNERTHGAEVLRDSLYPFYTKTLQELLTSEEPVNRAYSPLNLYMALSMLAELTDGNSRSQLLTLLNADGMDTVRRQASILWDANYSDDGAVTSLLANSLWLNQNIRFVPDTLNTLADTWHASSYQGEMGSEEFTRAFQSWLNKQTGGLLADQISNVRLTPNTVLALASTIYYRAQWFGKFSKNNTDEGIFHAADGDITCDFMHKTDSQFYYWSDNFSAISRSLENSGDMWLFLPDEGVSVNELATDENVLRLLLQNRMDWNDRTFTNINISMPKFDIVSELDLMKELPKLGITDIFDPSLSDFSPMTGDVDEIFVSQAKHAARISADEDGCIATAFTAMAMAGGAMPPSDEVDFTLDRPFLFVITGADGNLLFAGVVERP